MEDIPAVQNISVGQLEAFIAGYLVSTAHQVLPHGANHERIMTAISRTIEVAIRKRYDGQEIHIVDFLDNHMMNEGAIKIVALVQQVIDLAKILPVDDEEDDKLT